MVKCVMFDMGGTLVHVRDEEATRALLNKRQFIRLKRMGFQILFDDYKEAIIKVDNYFRRRYYGSVERWKKGLFVKLLLSELGHDIAWENAEKLQEDYISELRRYNYLIKGVIPTLRKIKNAGIKIVLVSNGSSHRTRSDIDKFKLGVFFDKIIISEEVGYEKSKLKPFEMVLSEFGFSPSECVMVGNRLDEDTHAKLLGIKTVLLLPFSKYNVAEAIIEPDFKVDKLEQVLPLVLG